MPATGTSTRRITSVPKAVDATASDEKTARATFLLNRCDSVSRVWRGRPISTRLTVE